MTAERDQDWLQSRLDEIRYHYFLDVELKNPLTIAWGRRARGRLGSIKYDKNANKSHILINSLLKDPKVPAYVAEATIGHELVHYAHGFSSSHPQAYDHPHRGGIVDKELKRRGLGRKLTLQQSWVKANWLETIAQLPRPVRRRRRMRYRVVFR
jgi:hypothetical protein